MSGSLGNGTLRIREPYNPVGRAMFLVSAAVIAVLGVICGYGVTDLYSSGESIFKVVGAALGTGLCFVCTYGLWRADLELRINDERIAARAWPFPSKVVPIDQVLKSEVVKIDPLRDYGGWGLKGTRRDMLIGGGGTTALRITYRWLYQSTYSRMAYSTWLRLSRVRGTSPRQGALPALGHYGGHVLFRRNSRAVLGLRGMPSALRLQQTHWHYTISRHTTSLRNAIEKTQQITGDRGAEPEHLFCGVLAQESSLGAVTAQSFGFEYEPSVDQRPTLRAREQSRNRVRCQVAEQFGIVE